MTSSGNEVKYDLYRDIHDDLCNTQEIQAHESADQSSKISKILLDMYAEDPQVIFSFMKVLGTNNVSAARQRYLQYAMAIEWVFEQLFIQS